MSKIHITDKITRIYSSKEISQGITQAVDLLRRNELVAFPTETVYGLGARIFSEEAIQKIYEVKGRPSDNPLISHISNFNQLEQIAEHIPSDFEKLASTFFPGPLTIIVPKKSTVPNIATANLPTIGVRMPNHPIALALIELLNEPIVAPSANLSGKPSPTTAEHVLHDLDGKIELILDGGPCQIGIESTILDLTTNVPTILRPGAVTASEIAAVIGKEVIYQSATAETETPKAPGMKYRHYAPTAKIEIIKEWNDELIKRLKSLHGSTVILSQDQVPEVIESHLPVWPLTTAVLYSAFRKADELKFSHIFIVLSQSDRENHGLIDRISKASKAE